MRGYQGTSRPMAGAELECPLAAGVRMLCLISGLSNYVRRTSSRAADLRSQQIGQGQWLRIRADESFISAGSRHTNGTTTNSVTFVMPGDTVTPRKHRVLLIVRAEELDDAYEGMHEQPPTTVSQCNDNSTVVMTARYARTASIAGSPGWHCPLPPWRRGGRLASSCTA